MLKRDIYCAESIFCFPYFLFRVFLSCVLSRFLFPVCSSCVLCGEVTLPRLPLLEGREVGLPAGGSDVPPAICRPPALPAHMHHVHQLHMHIALAHLMHLMHHPCMRIKPFSDAPHQPYVLHQLSLQNHGCTIQPVYELSYF